MGDETYQNFVDIIKALHKRREATGLEKEYLSAVQIAAAVKMFLKRKVFDQTMVSHVVSIYSAYFLPNRRTMYPKYTVDWSLVRRDHPSILPSNSPSMTCSPSSVETGTTVPEAPRYAPIEGYQPTATEPQKPKSLADFCKSACKALEDEYRQAKEALLSRPVVVRSYQPIDQVVDPAAATLDFGVTRIYEASLEYRIDEAPPIPEGVPVRVRWQYPPMVLSAKLLQWDLLNSKVYLAFPRALDNFQRLNQSRIELTTHELIRPLAEDLRRIESVDGFVLWKLLTGEAPQQLVVANSEIPGMLDDSQLKAVRTSIQNNYSMIWGPPGTGKTHTIGCLICEFVKSGKRVLATSISNVAVDNMAIKFLQNLWSDYSELMNNYAAGHFLRFGYTRNDELSKDKYKPLFSIQFEMASILSKIRQIKADIRKVSGSSPRTAAKLRDSLDTLDQQRMALTKRRVADAKVVFTTAAQVYINDAFEPFRDYDVVIIDEVSMMAIPTFSVVAARSKAQTVVVGDFRQLAPIAVSQSSVSHQYLHESPFEWLNIPANPVHPAMEMLRIQRRMTPSISQWISQKFYRGNLSDGDVVTHDYTVQLPSDLPSQLVLWDISKSKHKPACYFAQLTDSHSRFNPGSANCIKELASKLREMNPEASIAVISTYREQAYVIRRNLERSALDAPLEIQVGTVHTFQGSEADIVIWDTVDTSEMGLGQPYRADAGNRLTNVAISRAKKLMIVVCDRRILTKPGAQTTVGTYMELLRDAEPCERIIDEWLDQ